MRGRIVALLWVAWAAPSVGLAATPGASSGVYVSDQFRKLAARVGQELLVEELRRSCPPERPLCRPLAERLGDAVAAAVERDAQAVQVALGGLFLEATMQGLVHVTAGEAWGGAEPLLDPEAVRPLVECLAAGVAGRSPRGACRPPQEAAGALEALFRRLPCKGGDERHCAALVADLREGREVSPAAALRVLAALVTSDPIQRPDLRVILLELAALTERGVEGGLSPALLRFLFTGLSDRSAATFVSEGLVDFVPGQPAARELWDDQRLAEWAAAVARCGAPTVALDAWRAEKGQRLEAWRRQVLLGKAPDLRPVEALAGRELECADAADARALRELRRKVRYFVAPLRVHGALVRYGVAGLAAAAALDHVRTGDQARLERDLRRAFVYAVATLGRRHYLATSLAREGAGGPRVEGKDVPWLGDVLASCELAGLPALLGVTLPPAGRQLDVPSGMCLSIIDGRLLPAAAAPVPAPVPAPGATLAERLQAQAPALLARLAPLLEPPAAQAPGAPEEAAEGEDLSALRRALAALAEGDEEAARQALLRAGVDLLATHLERVTGELVGASAERCRADPRARTIFSRLGPGCAAHALLVGAYRPVAEYYWAGGRDAAGTASAAYRGLLASDAWGYTPIILNVGLGGTYVTGRAATWGEGGYGAFTVLDKFGLALYRRGDQGSAFECGVFAGGFLDALVRAAIQGGQERRYWLLGLTAGWPRLRGMNLGFELHAGAALPFEFGRGSSYGLATGAAVIVPFDTYLKE